MGEKKISREWVKTFAIIFLSILLVLTFFSNTIMNLTLPEVATDYISYGTIKTQVRGTGSAVANDNYYVTFGATREIKKVNVKVGDYVERDTVPIVLEEGESDELYNARRNYDSINYDYNKLLIDKANNSPYASKEMEIAEIEEDLQEAREKYQNAGDIEAAIDNAKLQLKEIEKEVTRKQKTINELETEQSAIGYTPTEYEVLVGKETGVTYEQYVEATRQIELANDNISKAKAGLAESQNKVSLLRNKYDIIKRDYDNINAKIETPLETLEESIKTPNRNIEALDTDIKYLKQDYYAYTNNTSLAKLHERYKMAQKNYRKALEELDELKENGASASEISEKQAEVDKLCDASNDAYDAYMELLTNENYTTDNLEKQLNEKEIELQIAIENIEKLKDKYLKTKEYDEQLKNLKPQLEDALDAYTKEQDKTNELQLAYDKAVSEKETLSDKLESVRNGYKYEKYKEYEDKIEFEKNELEKIKTRQEEAQEYLTDLQSDNTESEESLKQKVRQLEKQLETAQKELEKIKANSNEKLDNLEIQMKKRELEKARRDMEIIEKQYNTNQIVSPVAGIVQAVNFSSGQKTSSDAPLVEIALKEKGYKLSFTVSDQQAARLRPGQEAEITSYIPYGTSIRATLVAIKSDNANPGSRQKILEFSLEGDVTAGQSISLAVGDKNASYENTVPNTAIREDSDGKYILIIESKNTPISTRYITKRVGVTVTASDDTRSAISGDFERYAYIVSTSNKPINAGEQVKLVDR
ncbi:MAG: HlyD family efflux transporter periplasmic adaptor subunit [Clostridia bacterium]|nr:HlyD family efflux transporter periplasmic adaptor subunit [Clostridia bacterium]